MYDPKVTYLDPKRVTGKQQTEAPRNRSVSGYGKKIPTSWLLQLDGERWHRVYVVCYSNSGSAYVLIKGEAHYLGTFDPAHDPVALPSTINSPTIERRIRSAFRTLFGYRHFETVYEHDHWWVKVNDRELTYDAVDAEGPGSAGGFSFERV